MRSAGFTFVELLVVIGVTTILLALGVMSFRSTYNNMQARDAAQSITSSFQLAQALTRKKNMSAVVTLDLSANTVKVSQDSRTVSALKLPVTTVGLECRTSCPTPSGSAYPFTFTAPFGSLAWDVKVTLTRQSQTRYAYVLGQTVIAEVR